MPRKIRKLSPFPRLKSMFKKKSKPKKKDRTNDQIKRQKMRTYKA